LDGFGGSNKSTVPALLAQFISWLALEYDFDAHVKKFFYHVINLVVGK
jgi:hypothetical protein